jgi:hypothetical protein
MSLIPDQTNMRLLEILGVPHENLRSADILLRAGEMPVVVCRYLVWPRAIVDGELIGSEVRRFRVTLIGDEGSGG